MEHVTAESGLDDAAVAERRAAGRVNAQPHGTSRTIGQIARAHLFTTFNLVLGACGLAVVLLGRWLDAVFLFAAIANVIIGFVQELHAKRRLDGLTVLNRDPIGTLRSGKLVEVLPEDLVEDDVVLVRRGDQIPADGAVLTSTNLDVDESLLTGESAAVPKRPGETVLSGSSVVSGSGTIRLTQVGPQAHAVRLTQEARRFSAIRSEIRTALEKIARWVSIALVPAIAVVLNGQMQASGGWPAALESGAWRDAVVATIASVTIMVPQGLALLATVSFAVTAARLARGSVLVEELPAIEVLARVDVVCFDKTGTLTEGGVHLDGAVPLGAHGDAWRHALAWMGRDPEANATAAALSERFTQVPSEAPSGVVPFSSARRWSAVAFDAGPAAGAWILGAPEVLLDGTAGSEEEGTRQLVREASEAGLRTVLMCRAERLPAAEALPARLEPHAVVTFRERVREDAAGTAAYFREQGVALKVFSGDAPRTVAAAAREAGVVAAHDQAIDARTLPEGPAELADVVERHSVFGRVGPQQKKAMVEALQARGHVVAMTGDGVNDALALKTADLGIAMGNAAPATKAVARMVLLDGRFASLPAVVGEGRRIIANIERLSHLFLAKTTYAFLLGIAFGALMWEFPFLPRQTSTSDFLMIGFPSVVLALMPNPRRYAPGFLRRALLAAVPSGVVMAGAILAVFAYGRYRMGDDTLDVHSAAFFVLTVSGLWVLGIAARPLGVWKIVLVAAMAAGLVLVFAVPLSRRYHELAVPEPSLATAALIIAAAACAVIETAHQIIRRRPLAGAFRAPQPR